MARLPAHAEPAAPDHRARPHDLSWQPARAGSARRAPDEFTELSETLDDLLARLESSFDAQRRFVANASHELRTPLTLERTLLQVALADPEANADTLRATCQELLGRRI